MSVRLANTVKRELCPLQVFFLNWQLFIDFNFHRISQPGSFLNYYFLWNDYRTKDTTSWLHNAYKCHRSNGKDLLGRSIKVLAQWSLRKALENTDTWCEAASMQALRSALTEMVNMWRHLELWWKASQSVVAGVSKVSNWQQSAPSKQVPPVIETNFACTLWWKFSYKPTVALKVAA